MADKSRSLEIALKHHQAGDLDRAETIYRGVLGAAPGHPDALHLLGLIAHQRGDHETAAARIAEAIEAAPAVPSFHADLGLALHAAGRPEEAEASLHRALELKPGDPALEFKLGNVLADLKLYNAAAQAFQRALDADGGHAAAQFNLALALRKARRFAAAETAYRKALVLDPANADAHAGLGAVLRELGRHDAALLSLDTALESAPKISAAQTIRLERAFVLFELARVADGAAAMHDALADAPDYAERIAGTARRFHQDGAAEWAMALLDPLIGEDLESPHVAAAFALVAPGIGRADEAVDIVGRLSSDTALPLTDRRSLHFALARLHDERDAFDEAFAQFAKANTLFDSHYDRGEAETFVARSIAAFSRDAMCRMPGANAESDLPVFIVGMPRSGTTLVEQILSSHPRVHGGDELFAIPTAASAIAEALGPGARYPECMAELGPAEATVVARRYLDKLADLGGAAERVTDKMPDNYKHLGLIAVLFARARVVHCVREPIDCCLSNFFQDFIIEQLPYTANLADIGHHYALYRRLMRHWHAVLDIPILELGYEGLVADQEGMSRKLVAFCGLEWDEACLKFYQNPRPIRTWSFDQVRRPIYASSVGRSNHYRRHLGPLVDALEEGGVGVRAPDAVSGG